ncbi:TIGR02680 family protein [Nocardia wallacei]|uniref:TIGR02680 family protein n=1 Tax=Nocardia wallacei TaxID=480035 RepID=UPI0024573D64|nr:TIGR02680 family protein [Nocardia wallacei]
MSATPRKHFEQRWRLSRAGVVNVWHYLDTEFTLGGGRLILRGANGSGKSRALEMLLPFLLDADRRRMDATGGQKVSLDELMRTGARGQTNRIGYLWLELAGPGGYLTVGAHIKYTASAHRSEVRFFTTDLRVGNELRLIGDNREPLSRDALSDLVGAHNLGDAEHHRETIRAKVFRLSGEAGRDRFAGLMQLLHTLRSPDVGNRIDEGKLPQILSDALPPLSEQTLESAGERLDGLTETRLAQERLTTTLEHVRRFHSAYRTYAAAVLTDTAAALDGAVTDLLSAEQHRNRLAGRAAELAEQCRKSDAREQELRDTVRELDTAIAALQLNPLFKKADDLTQRDKAAEALRTTAIQALDSARQARQSEHGAAARTNEQFDEVRTTVRSAASRLATAVGHLADADLPYGDLPRSISCQDGTAHTVAELIMDSLDQKTVTVERPRVVAATFHPHDLDSVGRAAARCGDAAEHRKDQAGRRRQEAVRLDHAHTEVREQELLAEQEQDRAQHDEDEAQHLANDRDELAVALNQGWRDWISAPETVRIMPELGPDRTEFAILHADVEALCGVDAEVDDLLIRLEEIPEQAAHPVREALAVQASILDQEEAADGLIRTELLREQTELEAARDPAPPVSPWHRVHTGIPLWQTVDFQPELAESERAGVEAALLASGLLTAAVRPDGSLHAAEGEILVHPAGDPARSALSAALRPDPASGVPSDFIDTLLSRIGWNDPESVTSFDSEGGWRNGMLSGRHGQLEARHIGAAARAATRAARLAEIATQLGELDQAAESRDNQRTGIADRRVALDAHLRTAPRSRELLVARDAAGRATARAAGTRRQARTAQQKAEARRAVWSREFDDHRTICTGVGLPAGADDLLVLENTCRAAVSACAELSEHAALATTAADKARRSLDEFTAARDHRGDQESEFERHRRTWQQEAASVATLHETLDLPVEQLTRELESSGKEFDKAKRQLEEVGGALRQLIADQARATGDLEVAEAAVTDRGTHVRSAAELFNTRLRLPGLVAATGSDLASVRHSEDTAQVRQIARAALATLGSRKPFTVNQLLNALTRFGADTSGQLEVTQRVEHEVHLVYIDGADDNHHSASVLSYLERRVDQGRQALTEREREVFTGFVLGSVTDELRRRIQQAETLVRAMNDSLAGTRTSHGVGVSISWHLDRQDPELHRLLELVRIADQMRSAADNDDLVTLVRDRVELLHGADPAAGYADHLRAALDYRSWHSVEVSILGPEPNQRRRISRRAKISQGETRFVSYITLFAAADGYLSGLPEPESALRLVLLDDAFAKVDERAIGELMGLLVRLDIDFVMTGHALWGTVPEVPELDIYEIRRIGGSAVIPTRIHWDGKNRTYIQSVPS